MTIAEIMWLIVVAYAGVQVIFLLESHGRTRIAVALPLLFMAPILLGAFSAMQNDHHPTLLFTASPLVLTYLVYVDYRSLQLPNLNSLPITGPSFASKEKTYGARQKQEVRP